MIKALFGGSAVAAAAVLDTASASADPAPAPPAAMTFDTLTVTRSLTSTGQIIAGDNNGNPSIQAQTVDVGNLSAQEIGTLNGSAREFYAEYFSGEQVTLRPQQFSHPHSGAAGQLYVDQHTRLWFCKGGAHWVQLA